MIEIVPYNLYNRIITKASNNAKEDTPDNVGSGRCHCCFYNNGLGLLCFSA